MRADFHIALAAVSSSWEALRFCSETLRREPRLVLQAVRQTHLALEFGACFFRGFFVCSS